MPVSTTIPVLTLDRVENARCEVIDGRYRMIRRGWITGLNNNQNAAEVLASAMNISNMPAYDSAFPSSDPEKAKARLSRHIIDACKGKNTRAEVTLLYDQQEFSGPSGAVFVLTRRTRLVNVEASKHPTGAMFKVIWRNPRDSVVTGRAVTDIATLSVMVPMQEVIATGYFRGDPPDTMVSAIGAVNSATWRGLPKGFWLYLGEEDRTQDYGKSYLISLTFLTKLREDWSQYAGVRDPTTGRFIEPDAADMIYLQGLAYTYGIINTRAVGTSTNGVIKVGYHPLANFGTIFGF